MFGTVVDVAIGLIFIYLLFALFVSSLIEIDAGLTKWRARNLEVALKALLTQTSGGGGGAKPLDFQALYAHPNITGTTSAKPSYISAENFASALLYNVRTQVGGAVAGAATAATIVGEVIAGVKALPDGSLKTALNTAIDEAEGDWDRLKIGVETWFDHAMDRLSGAYKRYTQIIAFVLGLVIAVSFNINSISIAQNLFADPVLRSALVKQAERYVDDKGKAKSPPGAAGAANASPATGQPSTAPAPASADAGPPDLAVAAAAAREAELKLLAVAPFGWEHGPKGELSPPVDGGVLLGWILTALAGMLGGPFWFDLLGKVINMRNTGPKPQGGASAT